jgi:(4S)-4-hydroxy-5-phosphonooxypentane-2,3-dione isomerase
MQQPIYVFAKWKIKPENLQTVLALLPALVEATKKEQGNTLYKMHQGDSEPATLMIYEGYKSLAHFEAHRASEHFQRLVVGQILPLLESREVFITKALEF